MEKNCVQLVWRLAWDEEASMLVPTWPVSVSVCAHAKNITTSASSLPAMHTSTQLSFIPDKSLLYCTSS